MHAHTYRRPGRTGTGGKTAAACTAPRGPGGLGGRTAAPSGWQTRRGRSHSPGSFQLPGPGGAGLRSGTVLSCAGHVNTPITTITIRAAATRTNRPRRGAQSRVLRAKKKNNHRFNQRSLAALKRASMGIKGFSSPSVIPAHRAVRAWTNPRCSSPVTSNPSPLSRCCWVAITFGE